METNNTTKQVYSAIINVMRDIGAITKSRKNTSQNYNFRGVDDVLNALQPVLIQNNLIILPTILEQKMSEHISKSGGTLFRAICNMQFTLISAIDGSELSAIFTGEAMDSGDKATNKAMSTAYKYFCFQTFCIPTDEAKDSENDTHEVANNTTTKQEQMSSVSIAFPQSKKPADDDNREWLNLVDKAGNTTEKGSAAIQFIRSGGSVKEIAKKYKLSKSTRAELESIEQEVANA
jgi:hypothetical protein